MSASQGCVRQTGPPSTIVLKGAVPTRNNNVRLVVNADGFGLSAERNHGILTAHKTGIVTSTTVLGNAGEPAALRAELAQTPSLGVGVLLSLVAGRPVASPGSVPSLVDNEGNFPTNARDVLLVWAKAALRPEDIEREFDVQVGRFRDLGLGIRHLCTRDNLGFLPMVASAVEKVARRHAIPGLRTSVEKPTLAWATEMQRGIATAALGVMAWVSRRQLGPLRHGPQTWGYFESGRLDEVRILEILGRLGAGSHELICQPELDPASQVLPARSEVAALTSSRVREALTRRGIELCRWSDLF
jgi:chitin disaccharide deacetylase